jgi:hypothetical protein
VTAYADLEIGLHRWHASGYTVELRYTQPESDTEARAGQSDPAVVRFDFDGLGQRLAPEDLAERRGLVWLELTHDRLMGPVQTSNAKWLQSHLVPLQRQAALWDSQSRPAKLLFDGPELAEAESWAAAHRDELTKAEADFLEASKQRQAYADRERRNLRYSQGGRADRVRRGGGAVLSC